MELLERFTPAHGLVDSALADLRERHAVRERERLRLEKQARRQEQIAAVTAQAGALVRNRAVQGGAAALLVLVVAIASWSTIFPPKPIRSASPRTGEPKSAPATSSGPGGTDGKTGPGIVVPPAGGGTGTGGAGQKVTPTVDGRTTPETATPPITVPPPVTPGTTTAPATPKTTGQPGTNGGTQRPTPTGVQPQAGPERTGAPVDVVPPGSGTPPKPEPAPRTAGGRIRRLRRRATPPR